MSTERAFAAFIAHDGVTLVEHQRERGWVRAVGEWTDLRPVSSIDEAIAHMAALLSRIGVRKPRVAIAIEQFGVMHHLMTLPRAGNDVIESIVNRELQRVFSMSDPVAFTRSETAGAGANGPQQIVVAGAPASTVDALRALAPAGADVEIATVVPKAMHALYELSGAAREPTAVLVALESGPHLAFFLDGRLEVAIDPPITLEGDRPAVQMILDQLERGAVYFRQQFRGAEATRVLLAARDDEYGQIATAIEGRFTARVQPLFKGASSPEAVIAIGAALEARREAPLDLHPHPPTLAQRAGALVRGPMRYVAVAAAAIALIWGTAQVASLVSANHETKCLDESIASASAAVAPICAVAQRRADLVAQAQFIRGAGAERASLTRTLSAIATGSSDDISFDTLHIQRPADGWSATIEGTSQGATTTQAVYTLDALLRTIRAQHNVTSAALDDFDYPKSAADSLRPAGGPVTIAFHLSFTARRDAMEH